MTIGIIGLGLIGGSFAKAIKLHTNHTVLGYDISELEIEKAQLIGAIDNPLTTRRICECDYILIAVCPLNIIEYIKENATHFADGTVIIDCGGVKAPICNALEQIVKDKPWHFIGGHPMAGREFSGFSYAKDDLFENASMILTPYADTPIEITEQAKAFFLSLGFGKVIFASPVKHDEMIAFTSQMAHVISSAYARSDLALKHKGFSAGSFQDMTRVARLNEQMWTELFLLNSAALVKEIDGLTERLGEYRNAIANGDQQALAELLKQGRERKELLDS